jgi:hypothetical protein
MKRPKRFPSGSAVVCAVWLTATAAIAQGSPPSPPQPAQAPPAQANAPSTPVSPLTVEGTPRKVLEKQAHDFVAVYATPVGKLGLLARWNDPACVVVTGLIPEQANQFKARIEEVAHAVRAPVAPPKCMPNVEVVFTKDPQKYVDAAAAKSPAILGEKGVKAVTRPIQAWYASATQGVMPRSAGLVDDAPAPASAAAMIAGVPQERFGAGGQRSYRGTGEARRCVDPGVAAHNPRLESPEFSPTPNDISTTRLVGDIPCPHSLFLNVLIVVDAAHMGDVPVDLTADYLAMVALSQPQPRSLDGCLPLPSVLDLYAKDCAGREAPTGLSPADMAYLTGLYAADLAYVQLSAQSQQSDIAGRMVKIMTTAPKPAR